MHRRRLLYSPWAHRAHRSPLKSLRSYFAQGQATRSRFLPLPQQALSLFLIANLYGQNPSDGGVHRGQQQDVGSSRVQSAGSPRERPGNAPRHENAGRPSSLQATPNTPQQPSTAEGPIRAVTARGTKARGRRIWPASRARVVD